MNALITAKNGSEMHQRTYLGTIALTFRHTCITVNPETITVDSMHHGWFKNISLNTSEESVGVTISARKSVTIKINDDIVFKVLRHLVKNGHPYKVNFVGFYIEDSSGLSEYTHGLVGRLFFSIL